METAPNIAMALFLVIAIATTLAYPELAGPLALILVTIICGELYVHWDRH